jgi:hypothetical protein
VRVLPAGVVALDALIVRQPNAAAVTPRKKEAHG